MMTTRTPRGKKHFAIQALRYSTLAGLGGLAAAAGKSAWGWLVITL
ncbi:hypothetical protein ABZY68_23260 [Streptomyces sp. NPDC006482]